MFKLTPNLAKLSLIAASSLVALAADAHLDKNTDLNGGHYDDFGNYHCHQAGCQSAPSRNDFMSRRRNRTNVDSREQDLFYNEDDWPHWMLVGQCQDARTQVLEATSEVAVTWTNPRRCQIREGLWTDPYTGEQFTRAARLEIDHIIPPSYANVSNGYQWDDQKRMLFANDPLNLIPVSRDVHRKKRERPISRWRPPEESFHCEYAAAWRDVSNKYDLDLFVSDRSRVNSILEDCDIPERDFEQEEDDNNVDIRAGGIPLPL